MENETRGYPAFQYSIFIKNGRDQQIVVRADNIEEFKKRMSDIELVLNLVGVQEAKERLATSEPAAVKSDIPVCAVHKVPMNWKEGVSRSTGKPYAFWACNVRDENGGYCNYNPKLPITKGVPQTEGPNLPF